MTPLKNILPLIAVLASCSSPKNAVECEIHAHCNLEPLGSCDVYEMTGNQWCNYPDGDCPSGRRWSNLDTGDGLSGSCVVTESQPDASIADAGRPDGMAPDANTNDANNALDASQPDAMTGPLGQPCDTESPACSGTAPTCAVIKSGVGTNGICTSSCGQSDTGMPPPGGDALCESIGSTAGTPQCKITDGFNYSCVVGCGLEMGVELGGCPLGTGCQAGNICY